LGNDILQAQLGLIDYSKSPAVRYQVLPDFAFVIP
jgi:hypothetical protein